jgi:predicted nuclease of predicted toxin-antitoxin system
MQRLTRYKWRLYADNNVEKEIVGYLRSSGFDVLWIAEAPELQKQKDDIFHYANARKLGRYLITRDSDFWNDQKHPLKESPGSIILDTKDTSIAKYLPVLLRKLVQDYNPTSEALYLDAMKIRLSSEGIVIKMVDRDTQKVATESWAWADLL